MKRVVFVQLQKPWRRFPFRINNYLWTSHQGRRRAANLLNISVQTGPPRSNTRYVGGIRYSTHSAVNASTCIGSVTSPQLITWLVDEPSSPLWCWREKKEPIRDEENPFSLCGFSAVVKWVWPQPDVKLGQQVETVQSLGRSAGFSTDQSWSAMIPSCLFQKRLIFFFFSI